ncbi:MAG TPA: hypothetical protein ENJ79_06045 [Gammaproteobacteria bacterium]|nr:hypothetical protein [Gammaproteobacteria bacterium]
MTGVRRVALYLHGLHADDRQWLLENLDPDDRRKLRSMLTELEQMDVPRDQAWLPDLAGAAVEKEPEPSGPVGAKDYVDKIESADPERIAAVLDHETTAVVVQILNYRMWSWRQFYISRQFVQRRRCLVQALEQPGYRPKPRVQAALLEALAARLDVNGEVDQGTSFEAHLSGALAVAGRKRSASLWARLWRR